MKVEDLARPTKQQIAWQNLELGFYVHFGMNTFCDQEWGDGTDSPKLFNPSSFDARQWVKVAKDAGYKYFVLTAKHHDGFCLWPTSTTNYSVSNSLWKNGEGDVVKECADACKEAGMPFGVYLSPWDRHEPCYENKEAYDDFYCAQLTELLTQYGPIVEVWFDGAGSEGREYDWERIIGIVKEYQPDAMIFNMGQPTIRWVGNEEGVAPYPCWNTRQQARLSMFTEDQVHWLPGTPEWMPAECDVPIRGNHWFWHENDEDRIRSLDELVTIYEKSVGRGANLLLNVAPDDRGLIPDADIKRVQELSQRIQEKYGQPIATTSGNGHDIIIELEESTDVNAVILKEQIADGERVREYQIEVEQQGVWKIIAEGSAIGHKRIQSFSNVNTKKVKLKITEAVGEPEIIEFSVFNTEQVVDGV
ncbi:alpha-L-fucosidase [Alkalicoccobacillus porphyridii]|uniref:alpha-L-fucosidase n=1 Tax=Alkalicoccobacillus porphyridii TaxID=2597270 RepID=A0A553ZX59_9BACI|nr:alpha-L-fucosidase [Alkalicoccobacillus porphyridii]TSB46031.1 alpha-L-fucosidase [Alkalicoccobacillus porphyridii]